MIPATFLLAASIALRAGSLPLLDALDGMRSSIRPAGDVDGDRVPDLLLSNAGLETPETVWVLSGRDGSALLRVRGRAPGDRFGASIDGVGDVDGDGRGDFVVGAQGGRRDPRTGDFVRAGRAYVRVHSGLDGRVLFEHEPSEPVQELGACVAGTGDVDGDGRPDFAVAYEGIPGEAFLVSGRTGQTIWWFPDLMGFGVVVAGPGDLDADGHADLLIGDASSPDESAGRLRAFSGWSSDPLFEVWSPESDAAFPWSLAGAGDLDGDRVPDVLAGAESRSVRALSGKDGAALLLEWSPRGRAPAGDAFGTSIDSLGDLDDDGVPDVIVGANGTRAECLDAGYAVVYSGRDGRVLGEYGGWENGIDACALGDVDRDYVPDFALCIPLRREVRFVSGRTFATIRAIDWGDLGG